MARLGAVVVLVTLLALLSGIHSDSQTRAGVPLPSMILDPPSSTVLLGDWPPTSCLDGPPITLDSRLSEPITTLSPDPPFETQNLAAFEFEVHYDDAMVCIESHAGTQLKAVGAICVVEGGWPWEQPGLKRVGCVTTGKNLNIDELMPLAHVDVYPQRDFYEQLRTDPSVALPVQVSAANCDIGDEQGHAIPLDEVDDCIGAELTFILPQGKGDDDGDGCTNDRENGPEETLGGLRGALNPWDLYDTNGDRIIDLPNDIMGVIQQYQHDCR